MKIKIVNKFCNMYIINFYNNSNELLKQKVIKEKILFNKVGLLSENHLLSKIFMKDFINYKMNNKEFIYL